MSSPTFTSIKTALTRAEKSGDARAILAACDYAEEAFDTIGWPDWWARIERMRDDVRWGGRNV